MALSTASWVLISLAIIIIVLFCIALVWYRSKIKNRAFKASRQEAYNDWDVERNATLRQRYELEREEIRRIEREEAIAEEEEMARARERQDNWLFTE